MFIEYRPTEYIAKKNSPKQGLLGIIYIFHDPVIKKICFHTGYAAIENSWRTIDERESDLATTSVFDCQFSPVGRLMAIKNSVSFLLFLVYVRR